MGSLARPSVAEFLAKGRAVVNSAAAASASLPLPVTLVVGNESADLDSLCSAVLLAYLRTYCVRPYRLNIPLANMPRPDFSLKAELAVTFSHIDRALRPTDLLSVDDVLHLPAVALKAARWLLVDHNVPTQRVRDRIAHCIAGCIDHHADEGLRPNVAPPSSTPTLGSTTRPTPEADTKSNLVVAASSLPSMPSHEPHIIQEAGSCASLVVQFCRGGWDGLPENAVDMGLAMLGLAPVLFDTACLSRKVTDHDRRAIEYLESKFDRGWKARTEDSKDQAVQSEAEPSEYMYQRLSFYDEIQKAALNLEPFSVCDILRRDYKEWAGIGSLAWGISAIPADFSYMAARSDGSSAFLAMMKKFALSRSLDVLAVMTATLVRDQLTTNEIMERHRFVGGWTPQGAKAALQIIRQCKEPLKLVKSHHSDTMCGQDTDLSYYSCWQQLEVGMGRKAVAPLFRHILCPSAHLPVAGSGPAEPYPG